MEDLIYGVLVTFGIIIAIVIAVFVTVLPIIAYYRTRRLNHIYHQLNQIIELLGGKPYKENDDTEEEEE